MQRLSRALALLLALASGAALAQVEDRTAELAPGDVLRYRLVEGSGSSARETSLELLRRLASGDLEGAAALSTAPRRRFEELAKYRDAVGAEEFKRVYGRYFAPANRLVAEVATGAHRLLVWELGEAGGRVAGQFWVQIDGRFFLDDAPGEERSRLRRLLEAYRAGKVRFSG